MSAARSQLPLPFTPIRRASAAPVIEAGSNAEARAWLARTAAWPQRRLAIWGPPSAGKSRLLVQWAASEDAHCISGPTLRFAPPSQALAIDDAHQAPQPALLHMLNAALEAGHPVLLAAPLPPSRWPVDLPDLASRLRAITAVAIQAPEDTLLHALLARLLAERQLRPAAATLAWLLARLPRTHAAIAEAVDRLDQAALTQAAAISPALARQALPDLLADLPEPCEPPSPYDDFASSSLPPAGLL